MRVWATRMPVEEGFRARGGHALRALYRSQRLPRPLFIAGLSAFFGFGSFFLLVAALPLYFERALGLSAAQIGTVIGLSYLVSVFAYIAVGVLVDRVGGGRLIVWSAVGVATAAPLFGLLDDPRLLSLVALWQGAMMSAFALSCYAFAGQVTTPERRGAQMGLFGFFNNTAGAAAPPIGVFLLRDVGAPALFSASLLSGLVAALLGILLPDRATTAASGQSVRLRAWLGASTRLLPPASLMVAMGVAYGVVAAFMPGYLAARGAENPGLFYTAELVTILSLRTGAGAVSDRCGRPAVVGVGLALMGLSVTVLLFVSDTLGTIVAGLIAGAAWGLVSPVLLAWLFDLTPEDRRGLASAAYFIALDIGRAIGSIGLGYAAVEFGARTPFVVSGPLAAVVGLGLFVLVFRGPLLRKRGYRAS
jgi:MFS family permease